MDSMRADTTGSLGPYLAYTMAFALILHKSFIASYNAKLGPKSKEFSEEESAAVEMLKFLIDLPALEGKLKNESMVFEPGFKLPGLDFTDAETISSTTAENQRIVNEKAAASKKKGGKPAKKKPTIQQEETPITEMTNELTEKQD